MRFSFWLRGFVLLLLVGLVGCDSTDPQVDPEPSFQNPPDAIYVANQASATVSVIDPDSNAVVQTVDLTEKGFSENAKPHHVVVEPNGSAWYVSLINEDAVVKFNAQNEVVGQVMFTAPGMLSIHPTFDRLYAAHTLSINSAGTVAVIRRSDMTSLSEGGDVAVDVGVDWPHGLKVSPSGEYVYSSSLITNQVVAIDAEATPVTVNSPAVFSGPTQEYIQLDISADGETAYITGRRSDQVQILGLSDPTTPTLVDSVDVGDDPWHPQLSDDGETLYFGSKAANVIYAMDTSDYGLTRITGEGIAQPHGSALSPDGRYLYVSNNNQNGTYTPTSGEDVGTVVVIDTQTNEIQTVIEVGENPAGINSRWQPTEG